MQRNVLVLYIRTSVIRVIADLSSAAILNPRPPRQARIQVGAGIVHMPKATPVAYLRAADSHAWGGVTGRVTTMTQARANNRAALSAGAPAKAGPVGCELMYQDSQLVQWHKVSMLLHAPSCAAYRRAIMWRLQTLIVALAACLMAVAPAQAILNNTVTQVSHIFTLPTASCLHQSV
jgi:hypothetical protein